MALLVSGNLEIEESIFAPGLFLAELQEEFRPLSEFRHLTFILQQSGLDDDFQIKSDAGMLRKAISQLIDNAIKFTKQGEVVFGAERRENELEFFVRDTGTGIDEASHSKIFDHFTQENLNNTRGHEGSGLGLSISKKMIELLGGQIRFESVKGKGSTFYLSLPYKAII
jgi:signal transduction histidine kinase